jgi:4-amino-4-deoxy-L-arabinose transferase-like glycosyltransferase
VTTWTVGGSDTGDRSAAASFVAIGFVVALVVVAIARLALFGWAGVAADDARYVFVGLSTLDGHGPLTPSGNVFLLRSPAYGLALAAGSRLAGAGPIEGARIVAVFLTVAGWVAAVRFGWLLGGTVAAAATALALGAMPLVWTLLPTLRIDLPQAAGVVATLLALLRPTPRRWALAGLLFGLTVLVKETVLLLGLAPLAFLGSMPAARLARLWTIFLVAAAIVAGWWWIVVWIQSGAIFPLNAIAVIDRRDVGSDLRIDAYGLGLLSIVVAAWLVVIAAARRDRGRRLLVVAAACLLPPAAYATANGLNARNYAGLAVLSAIAIGAATSTVLAWIRRRSRRRSTSTPAALILAGVIALAVVVAGQLRIGNPSEPALPGQVAAWLRTASPLGGRTVMTFRYSEIVALDLYGHGSVPVLAAVRVDPLAAPSDFIWMGLRDRQLFGYARSDWLASLAHRGTDHLVLAGPHPLTPAELVPDLDGGMVPGLVRDRSFAVDGDSATSYRVDPTELMARGGDIPLHLSPAAALAWIDLATAPTNGDPTAAITRLASGGTVIVGPTRDALTARLAGIACLVPGPGSGAALEARIHAVGPGCPAG